MQGAYQPSLPRCKQYNATDGPFKCAAFLRSFSCDEVKIIFPRLFDHVRTLFKKTATVVTPTTAAAPESFGAKEATELSWKNLMDAYSCSECGRCTDACPANSTGKLLSPRKIMMATRDRIETISKNIAINKVFVPDGKTLLHDYITVEELRACTTCNACVQECPISISPLDIIIELRRSLVMEQSNAPQEWNSMFSNIENNFAPWKFSPDDRDAWTKA